MGDVERATRCGSAEPHERRCRGQRGDSLVSVLLLMPVLVLFLELVVLGGRVATTRSDIESAAREAARNASISQSWSSASMVIGDSVDRALSDKGFRCAERNQFFGAATSFVAGGRVEIVVSCTVELSDLGFLPVPGSHTIYARATEPLDRYRVVE